MMLGGSGSEGISWSKGGKGSYIEGNLILKYKTNLTVKVGTKGEIRSPIGGFPDGGNASYRSSGSANIILGGGGGSSSISVGNIIIAVATGGSGAGAGCVGAPGGGIGFGYHCENPDCSLKKEVRIDDENGLTKICPFMNQEIDYIPSPGSGGGYYCGWQSVSYGKSYDCMESYANSGSSFINNSYVESYNISDGSENDYPSGDGFVNISLYCPTNCISCSIQKICSECADDYFLKDGHCTKTCGNGFYANTSSRTCEKCSDGCMSCTDANTCNACSDDFLNENGKCVSKCSDKYFETSDRKCLPCDSNCQTCKIESTLCTSCSNKFLQGTKCVTECDEKYYLSDAKCLRCHPSCEKCSGPGSSNCLSCPSGRYLNGTTCVDDCGNGFFSNPGMRRCDKCNENCNKCSSNGTCQSCQQNFHNLNGKCISKTNIINKRTVVYDAVINTLTIVLTSIYKKLI